METWESEEKGCKEIKKGVRDGPGVRNRPGVKKQGQERRRKEGRWISRDSALHQNTPFPGLNLKVGKIYYRVGKMRPIGAICTKCSRSRQAFFIHN